MSAGKHTHADRQYTGTLNAILRIWKTEGKLPYELPSPEKDWQSCRSQPLRWACLLYTNLRANGDTKRLLAGLNNASS